MTWDQRLKRVFRVDMETCRRRGGRVKCVARIEDPGVYPSGSSTTWTVPRATAAGLKAHERTALRCGFDPVPTAAPSAAARGHLRAQTAVGCKHAMEARQVHPRFRNLRNRSSS